MEEGVKRIENHLYKFVIAHSGIGYSTLIINQENGTIDLPPGQSDGGIFWFVNLSSVEALACFKLPKKTSQKNMHVNKTYYSSPNTLYLLSLSLKLIFLFIINLCHLEQFVFHHCKWIWNNPIKYEYIAQRIYLKLHACLAF